ncbi:s8 family peptidase [Trichoderma cornu-damae]|uniref:S8 family peptidase n=1 Tax=Trichoderma cornu-damae TaxID=654480 RepID=A0A9P8TXK0_9HYPO|nr:s8 family peptidase [Trichoderma cornu-damae]
MQMAHWQDFHLVKQVFVHYARIEIGFDPTRGHFRLHRSKLLEPEPGPGPGESLADVLCKFRLAPRDKVILASTIAQAYHHFYDSDLMRIKWRSEAIWFMAPPAGRDEMPLRPYLMFPFGTRCDPEEDFVDDANLVHQHPRILAMGILLLEIGLSKPFQSFPQRNGISQVNRDHLIATNWLKELRVAKWENFTYKTLFDKAIEYCIQEGRLLVDPQSRLYHVGAAKESPSKAQPDKQKGILARRKKFYSNVVLPLKWLAETGFSHRVGSKPCIIRRNPTADSPNREPLGRLPQPESSFHSGRGVNPAMWLRDLNRIGTSVESQRREHRVKTPIRVAILDTGIFEKDDNSVSWRIKDQRDFVDKSAMADTFGHGTLMARLVMECAPSAQIIVARVAKNTKELQASRENVENAILWAGIECRADIVSMSFGFPKDHEGIDNAIKTVQSERKGAVIFLASAGNSPMADENFPARHPSVISIYAANCRGTFMETNPRLRDGASAAWGTYGSDIPDDYCADIREKHPGVCQPGSSIATAVAAGFSATMIAYADLLPHVEPSIKANEASSKLELLRRKSGMEALFKSMVKNKNSRQWFVDPISFWRDTADGDTEKHFTRYTSIHLCLQELSLKL